VTMVESEEVTVYVPSPDLIVTLSVLPITIFTLLLSKERELFSSSWQLVRKGINANRQMENFVNFILNNKLNC
jgi:hypothetical protein